MPEKVRIISKLASWSIYNQNKRYQIRETKAREAEAHSLDEQLSITHALAFHESPLDFAQEALLDMQLLSRSEQERAHGYQGYPRSFVATFPTHHGEIPDTNEHETDQLSINLLRPFWLQTAPHNVQFIFPWRVIAQRYSYASGLKNRGEVSIFPKAYGLHRHKTERGTVVDLTDIPFAIYCPAPQVRGNLLNFIRTSVAEKYGWNVDQAEAWIQEHILELSNLEGQPDDLFLYRQEQGKLPYDHNPKFNDDEGFPDAPIVAACWAKPAWQLIPPTLLRQKKTGGFSNGRNGKPESPLITANVIQESPAEHLPHGEPEILPSSYYTKEIFYELCNRPIIDIRDLTTFLKELLPESYLTRQVGVWEGYSLEQHTLNVLRTFMKYFEGKPLPGNVNPKLFLFTLLVHDLGKPVAVDKHQIENHHQETIDMVIPLMQKLGFSQSEIDLSCALIDGDPIGAYLSQKHSYSLKQCIEELRSMHQRSNLSRSDFFDLLCIFYSADAASYPVLRHRLFTVDGKGDIDFSQKEHAGGQSVKQTIQTVRDIFVGAA